MLTNYILWSLGFILPDNIYKTNDKNVYFNQFFLASLEQVDNMKFPPAVSIHQVGKGTDLT